jgi:hypothetical protein
MQSSSNANDVLRHGAYLCLTPTAEEQHVLAAAPVAAMTRRLGLENEFSTQAGHPRHAVAFLRRVDVIARQLADHSLAEAKAMVHVASDSAAIVDEFCSGLLQLVDRTAIAGILKGVVRPPRYTGAAMHEFAYARQVSQQPGDRAPHAFLVPMKKTPEWWEKDWMERHTYFLPRFDESGSMINHGHALAAAAGIPCLMRRTYKALVEPAPACEYDFTNYFECADSDVQTFHAVCTNLRDTVKNPEWQYVREGPTWHGKRVEQWEDLFR